MSRLTVSTALALWIIAAAACAAPTQHANKADEPSFHGMQPYPYSTPVPALLSTPLDGSYVRTVTVVQAGGKAIPCRRCAPYRLDAGTTALRLDRGRFFILFRPRAAARLCPDCKPRGTFHATGHFVVDTGLVRFFNDPHCVGERGSYSWKSAEGILTFKTVSDRCFGGIRGRFLAAYPWKRTGALLNRPRPDRPLASPCC